MNFEYSECVAGRSKADGNPGVMRGADMKIFPGKRRTCVEPSVKIKGTRNEGR